MTGVEIVVGIVTVALGAFFWWVKPGPVKAYWAKRSRRLAREDLAALEDADLAVEHRSAFPAVSATRKKRSRVFWPVVPPESPSLIHAAFLRYVELLDAFGLQTTLFVFDQYTALVRGWSSSTNEQARGFVHKLQGMGLGRHRHEILYESEVGASTRGAAKVLPHLLRYVASLSDADLRKISGTKSHITPSTPAIRVVKPILNMVYFLSTDRDYGYTLSGEDERPLWDAFHRIAAPRGITCPVNLFIPTMSSVTGRYTHALDTDGNMYAHESREELERKVRTAMDCGNEDHAVSYFLRYIHLPRWPLPVVIDDGETALYRDYEGIKEALQQGRVTKEGVEAAIVQAIEDVFAGNIGLSR